MGLDQRAERRVCRRGRIARLLGVLCVGAVVACSGEGAPDGLELGEATEANAIGANIATRITVNPDALVNARRSQIAYHDTWRKLWEDHITWTRMVTIGVLDCLPGKDVYTARLLQNAVDMQTALRAYYPAADVDQFGVLLQDHLVIAAGILAAAELGDTEEMNALIVTWGDNAHALATHMSEMNPEFWPFESTHMMWQEHLDVTLAQATLHLTGDFAGEVAVWEKLHEGGLEMADLMSRGTMRALPGAFQGCVVP